MFGWWSRVSRWSRINFVLLVALVLVSVGLTVSDAFLIPFGVVAVITAISIFLNAIRREP